ncbi:FAD-binding oxidoreductase [Phanerochaete sordida]|uniref:FAD-binding oxidoreductase n=1 Tax=Phanerochaete sordida TaxID=48140 RepID=A0A9P3G076_9APHY|nr:FAD-binding oxidoreductase [Phanerochaete sordida]
MSDSLWPSTGFGAMLALMSDLTGTYAHPPVLGVDWSEWTALNASIGGQLRLSTPFELPCFASFEGHALPPDSAACAAVQANYTDAPFRVAQFGAAMNAQWETCQSTGAKCLLDDANPSSPAAYQDQNCDIGNIAPLHIDVRAAEHVQAAYEFSSKHGVRLSVKNTGHDYAGRSSGHNTLGLWVSTLNKDLMAFSDAFVPEQCDGSHKAITIGAGVKMEDMYAFADKHNVTAIGGYHRTVATGYFLGGGHSVLSTVYGLGADRVVQIKVVTPDGKYRTVNKCQDSDLFWALRGGGGSAFGVVTELTVTVEPQLTIQAAVVAFPPSPSTLTAWYKLMADNALEWSNAGWGIHLVPGSFVAVNPRLDNAAASKAMQGAVDLANAQGGTAVVDELPSFYEFFTKYVVATENPVGPEVLPSSRLLSNSLFATESGKASLLAAIAQVPSALPIVIVASNPNPALFAYEEGSTSFTPAWRDSAWHFLIGAGFAYNSTLADRQQMYTLASQLMQPFRELTPGSGAYFNEADVYEPNHEQSFWGSNYAKLAEVKKKYDPNHIMDCWQCVGWKGASDPLFTCYVQV